MIGRAREDRPRDSRRRPHPGIPGQSFVLNAISSNYGGDVHHPQAVPRAPRPALSAEAIAARAPAEASAADSRRPASRLRRAGRRRPGQRRRLQADGRGPATSMPRRSAGPGRQPGRRQGNQQPRPGRLFNGFRANTPQLYVDIDRAKCKTMGVELKRRLRHAAGLPGRLLRQRLQPLRPHLAGQRPGRRPVPHRRRGRPAAQGPQRDGDMVPLGAVADIATRTGPVLITRYNMFPAATINGVLAARRQHRRRAEQHGAPWPRPSCRAS